MNELTNESETVISKKNQLIKVDCHVKGLEQYNYKKHFANQIRLQKSER